MHERNAAGPADRLLESRDRLKTPAATTAAGRVRRGDVPLPPAFFIVGAPRCGTSLMSKALAKHPDICFSRPKETHYFLTVPDDRPADLLRAEFAGRYFPDLAEKHRAMGEGSVSYLYEPRAIERALRFDPRARFVVHLRSPLDMLRSYHDRMLFLLDEDEPDFAKAWDLQAERTAGRRIPKTCRDPRLLAYGEVARFGHHLERLFAVAGRERCHVVLFDDLAADPRRVYLDLLAFLELPDDGRRQFVRDRERRESRSYRWRVLQRLTFNPPPWLLSRLQHLDAGRLKRLRRLRQRLKRLNAVSRPAPELTPEMAARLAEHFAADVALLSELLGRDLSHWLHPQAAARRAA